MVPSPLQRVMRSTSGGRDSLVCIVTRLWTGRQHAAADLSQDA
jgi:hypothetical protein